MKKTFRLEGLDCAHCASKIEAAVQALEGVSAATVYFVTSKMVIEGDCMKFEEIVEKTKKLVARIEPDVIVKKV